MEGGVLGQQDHLLFSFLPSSTQTCCVEDEGRVALGSVSVERPVKF